jgi:hypothetical protein
MLSVYLLEWTGTSEQKMLIVMVDLLSTRASPDCFARAWGLGLGKPAALYQAKACSHGTKNEVESAN